MTDDLGSKE
jgi:hypothetical protein